jgi:hypothetical protein
MAARSITLPPERSPREATHERPDRVVVDWSCSANVVGGRRGHGFLRA